MGKKIVKFPSVFKKRSNDQWQWPSSCKHPTTYSFRAAGFENDDDLMFKTVNSIFLDTSVDKPSYSWFTNTEYSPSPSDTSEQPEDQLDDQLEQIIRGVRSDRLFFEPCNSILSSTTTTTSTTHVLDQDVYDNDTIGTSTNVCYNDAEELPFKESVVLAMESEDPYEDFKGSMLEMVESHGIKDWKCLEELLEWYLKMNGKINHGIIVQAFVDLLVGLASDDSTSFSSAASSFSTSSSSPLSTASRERDL